MIFCLQQSPYHESTLRALREIQRLLAAGEKVFVFCYQDAVYLTLPSELPADEFNPHQALVDIANEHQLSIHVCSGAAARRGITNKNTAAPFEISGLITLCEQWKNEGINHLLIHFTTPPFESLSMREGQDLALAASGVLDKVSVVFSGAACEALSQTSSFEGEGRDFTKTFKAFPHYDIEDIHLDPTPDQFKALAKQADQLVSF